MGDKIILVAITTASNYVCSFTVVTPNGEVFTNLCSFERAITIWEEQRELKKIPIQKEAGQFRLLYFID